MLVPLVVEAPTLGALLYPPARVANGPPSHDGEKLESDTAYKEGYAAGVSTMKQKAQQEEEHYLGVVAPPSDLL
ncbi:hypothetical protein FRC06_001252 [Ceratobasidium sp. 370]|nr:hypothetical protein FRC06_001252 [Ceratobasidium sp. 370]